MKIVDIHAHVYPRVAGITRGVPMTSDAMGVVKIGNKREQFLPPSFEHTASTSEMLIAYMDWCGIEKALLMPNPFYGYHNDYSLESVCRYPNRLKAVALADLVKGKEAADELADLYTHTELFGFKVETDSTFQCAPWKRMTDEDILPVWDCINQYHQPVFLHLFTNQDIEEFQKLVKLFPSVTWIICHMGADACFGADVRRENFDLLLDMVCRHSNIYMDTSTVPIYFKEEYPFPSAVKIIEKAYERAGAEKLMWASDYPGMLNHATMKQLINLVRTQCHIPQSAKELIMGKNAEYLFWG